MGDHPPHSAGGQSTGMVYSAAQRMAWRALPSSWSVITAGLEMRLVMEELLGRTISISAIPGKLPQQARYPASGYSSLPLQLR